MSARIDPLAGKPAPAARLVDVPRLITAYYTERPDPGDRARSASPSAPPGTAAPRSICSFNEVARAGDHARRSATTASSRASTGRCSSASTPTRCRRRPSPARSRCSRRNGVEIMIAAGDEYTPTPAISHAILTYNRGRTAGLADGIVITPSHNPPDERRLQVQPAERRARRHRRDRLDRGAAPTRCCESGLRGRARACRYAQARRAPTTHRTISSDAYVDDLARRHRHGGDPRRRACAWASIRWAAPACTTGRASPSATGSI